MTDSKKQIIDDTIYRLTENYIRDDLFIPNNGCMLPDRSAIISIVDALRNVIFP